MKNFLNHWKDTYLSLLTDNSLSPWVQRTCLGLILLLCLTVRIYTIEVPPLDRTQWKEIDYIMISTNYWKNGYNFLSPEISWPAEPPRVTAMELPVVPYLAAVFYKLFGYNVFTVRLIPLLSFLLMSIYVFRLGKRELGPLVGLSAALAASIMPLYHSHGNLLFSDPLMIAFSVMALFHFAQWIDFYRKQDWLLAMLAFSLAVALKLTPLYLLLPLFWIVFRKHRLKIKEYKSFIFFVLFSLVLPLIWYSYAYYLTQTSIDVFGIFGGHDKMQTKIMLSDFTWYRTILARLHWQILGGIIGILFCSAGILASLLLRRGGLFFFYFAAVLSFFAIVAEGQIDAVYRQFTIIPVFAVFIALGSLTITTTIKTIMSPKTETSVIQTLFYKESLILSAIFISTLFAFNYGRIFNYFTYESPPHSDQWELAQHIKKKALPDSKLVTVGEYSIHKGGNDLSPVLYYYAGLQGWSLQKGDWHLQQIQSLIQKGATLFAALNMSRESESDQFINEMKARYEVIYENEGRQLLLLDLLTRKEHPAM